MNILTKANLVVWSAGQKIKQGAKQVFNIALTLSNPKTWDKGLWNLQGSQSVSGEVVTEQTALTYSAVYNAISLISGTIGSLPLHLMQKKDKSKQYAEDNSLYNVMHNQWNQYMTAMAGREVSMAHILTYGNSYAEIVRDTLGRVQALWPIPPNRVEMKWEEKELVYVIQVKNGEIELPWDRVLHIPGLGFDGIQGYSPITMASRSIGLGMAMETYGSLYFKHGTHPGVVVTHPGTLSDPKKLRNALNKIYSGLGNSHRLMLLEESMKVERLDFNPEESQFLEGRQFQIPEIARWFNLPPHKLKDLTKSSFNNIEQEQISFVTDSILPWLIRLEQSYFIQLLSKKEQKERYYFKHVVEGLLRGDAKSRAEFYQIMKRNGIMTPNEIRSREDLNPHPDPLADELWVEVNMMPLSKLDEYLKKNVGKNPVEKEPEQLEEEPKDRLKLITNK